MIENLQFLQNLSISNKNGLNARNLFPVTQLITRFMRKTSIKLTQWDGRELIKEKPLKNNFPAKNK